MVRLLLVVGFVLCSSGAYASELNSGDVAWMLTSTALVLFMTLPGLALFYSGLVRSKNVLSVLMQCFALTCLMSFLWLIFGYGLSFGDGGSLNSIIGSGNFLLSDLKRTSMASSIPESVFVMFQMTFHNQLYMLIEQGKQLPYYMR